MVVNPQIFYSLLITVVAVCVIGCTSQSDDVQQTQDSIVMPPVETSLANSSFLGSMRDNGAYGFGTPNNGGKAGISVSGFGEVLVKPDVAKVYLGVESTETTVQKARQSAGNAMAKILRVAKAYNVADKDIQTTSFRIAPKYSWNEKQILIGYVVSNQVTVVLRNLDDIGHIIDQSTNAVGDLARINGVEFLVENREIYENSAREAAVRNALDKAAQYARLTGVVLGPPLMIEETSLPYGNPYSPMLRAEAFGDIAGSTPISEGESSVSAVVAIVFGIR